jgi:hypothetical protein
VSVPGAPGMWPRCGTRPWLGLWPNTPQQCAGTRIDPPMSLPSSRLVKPAATAAAEPPDEPPGVRVRSHGLLVVPKIGFVVCQSPAQVGVFVLPKITAPAARRRATAIASAAGT